MSYLVTCIGNEAEYEPERLLGSCLGALHAHPVLTADMLQQMVQAHAGTPLEQVDLAEQPGRLTVTTIDLSPTELASLWASLFGVGYQLSCAVQVETVVIGDAAPPPVIYR